MSNFRLLQLVMFAGLCLLLLKSSALLLGGGTVFTGHGQLQAQEAPGEVAGKAAGEEAGVKGPPKDKPAGEKNEAVADAKGEGKTPAAQPEKKQEMIGPMPEAAGKDQNMKPVNYADERIVPSDSELDLLESLAVRRKQLNLRESQLKLKENLLKAAQKQIEERIEQLKALEAKIQVDLKKKDVLQKNQYKRLVKIYSSMKAKEAARIFDGLDMPVLVDLMRAMKAISGSQILAKMNPEKARALTLLLARKSDAKRLALKKQFDDLPAIEGEKPAAENQ